MSTETAYPSVLDIIGPLAGTGGNGLRSKIMFKGFAGLRTIEAFYPKYLK